jgi:predicted nucleic acid-binding protein
VTSFLIDSGALLAMIDASDTHHLAAASFVRSNKSAVFYLTDTVFSETMVLIKARLGIDPAVELGERIMNSSHFQVVNLTAKDRRVTWEIFSSYTDKGWSYVDCSILAIARRLSVPKIFAFDRHFDQMTELIRVPTP